MNTKAGGCVCKTIRYEFSGAPVISYKCHCLDCQRTSGAGAIAAMWVQARQFKLISGEVKFRENIANSGRKIARGFCAECGTPVMVKLSIAGIVGIYATSLDDISHFKPEYEIWTSRARPWEILCSSIPHFTENFPSEIVTERLTAL